MGKNGGMNIRRLGLLDRDTYHAALLRGVRESAECFRISANDVLNHPSPFDPSDPNAFTLGAFAADGALAGVVSVAREKGEKVRHKALLFRMYVLPEYEGKGLGRALMQEAMRLGAVIPGVEQIQLTVLSHNERAKHLYQSLGFIRFSLEKDAVKWQGKTFDEERLAREI